MSRAAHKRHLSHSSDTSLPSVVIDRRGMPVDISGERWLLNEPTAKLTLDWALYAIDDKALRESFKRYFAWLITTQSPMSVFNSFRFVEVLTRTSAFREADEKCVEIPYLAFSEARASLSKEQQWQLHYSRQLYRWCAAQGYSHFSTGVADKLGDIVIGGNAKGQAVRSKDPTKGPLDAQEVASLTSALRSARVNGSMPLGEQAIVWLALTTGSNASQYASLREEDLREEKIGDQVIAYILRVPRQKKGHVQHRAEFRERRLTPFVGQVIAELIAQNQAEHPAEEDDYAARPLLRAKAPAFGHNHPLADWAWHTTRGQITNLLKRSVQQLGVLSRTGDPLCVSFRRFRYTLATRAIDNGASAYEVADVLDHSDLQNVGVYFDVHSNIVEHLDQTMALALAPRAQAFAKLVENEASAIRGDVSGSRVYHGDRERDLTEPVGTCGNHSFCNVSAAPLACYTCPMFQPWMDGPHDLVLESLLRRREKSVERGLNQKVIAMNDHVIIEVAGVIQRIADKRAEQHG
ncbi:tyrosine-type recombinase/integrase [Qipengyuania citrea]|uniref:tyrosine-type recombinase/integrase n=1 Tax=Qipengyuania citrea TaxID=225971 RepID=UPI0032976B10